jgi:spoIIIJ-associated protein
MSEICEQAASFLQSVVEGAGLKLDISLRESPGECVLDFEGSDAEVLQTEGGELLDALQHLVNQAFGRKMPTGQRLVCDVHSFRATREAELRAMALHAAEQVRTTGTAFLFGPMTGGERRVIHLTLAESEDLQTESVGEGAERKLRVSRKPSS